MRRNDNGWHWVKFGSERKVLKKFGHSVFVKFDPSEVSKAVGCVVMFLLFFLFVEKKNWSSKKKKNLTENRDV